MNFEINNLEQLDKFASCLAKEIVQGDVFSLKGDLGAGKTTLVQFLGKHLGIEEYITSPTFSLVNIYDGLFQLNHLDLYRIEDPNELENIDFENYFYPDGVTFIEWAEKAGDYLPEELIELEIRPTDDRRIIRFTSKDDRTRQIEEAVYESFSN